MEMENQAKEEKDKKLEKKGKKFQKVIKSKTSISAISNRLAVSNMSLEILHNGKNKFIEYENYLKAEIVSKKIKKYEMQVIRNKKKEFTQQKEQEHKNYEDNNHYELKAFKEKWYAKEKEWKDYLENHEQQIVFSK